MMAAAGASRCETGDCGAILILNTTTDVLESTVTQLLSCQACAVADDLGSWWCCRRRHRTRITKPPQTEAEHRASIWEMRHRKKLTRCDWVRSIRAGWELDQAFLQDAEFGEIWGCITAQAFILRMRLNECQERSFGMRLLNTDDCRN